MVGEQELMAYSNLLIGCIPHPASEMICCGFLFGEIAGNNPVSIDSRISLEMKIPKIYA